MSHRQSDINGGPNGQSGSDLFRDISSATYTLSENDSGKVLRVSSACTITCPADGPAASFYCEILRVGAGAVDFLSPTTLNSTAGSTPSISAQWGSAVATRHASYWHVGGAIA